MKHTVVGILLLIPIFCMAQWPKPAYVSLSYFGEMISHPGLKIGAEYPLRSWEKEKIGKNGQVKFLQKHLSLNPTLGGFYHKGYQSGIFVLPEFGYSRTKNERSFFGAGIGLGYLRTSLSNAFVLGEGGQAERIRAGNNHLLSSYYLSFGRKLGAISGMPVMFFLKPQFLYAWPNYRNGVGYLGVEAGLRLQLRE